VYELRPSEERESLGEARYSRGGVVKRGRTMPTASTELEIGDTVLMVQRKGI
jgi:hypothetical protein